MEPAQPDPVKSTGEPVGNTSAPRVSLPPEMPPEVQTIALRPGAAKRLQPEEKPVEPPVEVPAPAPPDTADLSDNSTVAINKVAQVRAAVPPPVVSPPTVSPESANGSTVSIHQVKRMRSLLEAPPPPAQTGDPPGTTTVPIRRGAGPRLVPPEAVPPLPATESAPSPEEPIKPKPSAPGTLRPRPSAPGTLRPKPSAPGLPKPPTQTEPPANLDPKLLCPRCKVKLISPESLGMCPSCGYCRSLEEGKDKVPSPPKRKGPSFFGLVEFCQLLSLVPLWFWVLVGGMAIVVVGTMYGPRNLLAEGPPRAWWGTVQFVLGVLLLAVAQGGALTKVAAQDEGVGPMDVILPGRVWRLVLERLPQTRALVWMVCWGFTLTFSALFLSGVPFTGLTGPDEGLLARELREALKAMNEDDWISLRASAEDDVKAASTSPAPQEPEGKDTRPIRQCAVVGYTRDAEGKPAGLIVAAPEKGRLRYVGIVRTGLRKSRELLEQLGVLENVNGPSESGAVWIKKPDLTVNVHHSGTAENGTLSEPHLGGPAKSE